MYDFIAKVQAQNFCETRAHAYYQIAKKHLSQVLCEQGTPDDTASSQDPGDNDQFCLKAWISATSREPLINYYHSSLPRQPGSWSYHVALVFFIEKEKWIYDPSILNNFAPLSYWLHILSYANEIQFTEEDITYTSPEVYQIEPVEDFNRFKQHPPSAYKKDLVKCWGASLKLYDKSYFPFPGRSASLIPVPSYPLQALLDLG